MENTNLKNNQVINESLFLSTCKQSEPKKITLEEFIKKHRSSKTHKEEIIFNWVHLASTENTYWGVVKLISKWIKKSIKAITRVYKALVSFCRVSNYQNQKIIEIWANSKHEQMYVFSIKAGFKQFLREFQKLIRKAIKQLKSKPKAKPKQKTSKISGIESKFKTHPYQERFISDNSRYVLSKLLVPSKSIKTRYDNCAKIETLSCDEPSKDGKNNTLVWFDEANY